MSDYSESSSSDGGTFDSWIVSVSVLAYLGICLAADSWYYVSPTKGKAKAFVGIGIFFFVCCSIVMIGDASGETAVPSEIMSICLGAVIAIAVNFCVVFSIVLFVWLRDRRERETETPDNGQERGQEFQEALDRWNRGRPEQQADGEAPLPPYGQALDNSPTQPESNPDLSNGDAMDHLGAQPASNPFYISSLQDNSFPPHEPLQPPSRMPEGDAIPSYQDVINDEDTNEIAKPSEPGPPLYFDVVTENDAPTAPSIGSGHI